MTLQRWRAVLGYGGLVPFVSLALLVWLTPQPVARFLVAMQLAYGAMILCFVGSVHWGRSHGPDTGRVGGATLVWCLRPSPLAFRALPPFYPHRAAPI